MFCTGCGNRIDDGGKFCAKCGARAPEAADATSSAAAISVAMSSGSAAAVAPAKEEPVTNDAKRVSAKPDVPLAIPGAESYTLFGQPATPAESHEEFFPGEQHVEQKNSGAWMFAFLGIIAIVGGFIGWQALGSRASGVSVKVEPVSVHVAPNATVTIRATVAGDPDHRVVWSMLEGGAVGVVRSTGVVAKDGTIAAAAEYTAPLVPGTYHVLATSVKDKKQASSTEVVVQPVQ